MEPKTFRKEAMKSLTNRTGVYALCDLDGIPIYVGQSTDGIRARVQRYLTSARSDIIANRQIDVWEIAFVMAWPMEVLGRISVLEDYLFHHFDQQIPLMNGKIPADPGALEFAVPEVELIAVMAEAEVKKTVKSSAALAAAN